MTAQSISNNQRSGTTFLWLAYTLFFFIQPIMAPSRHLWFGTIGVFSLFICVFWVYIQTPSETTRRWMIAATFAIAATSFPWNVGASTFFVYTAAFIPFSFESKRWVLVLFSLEAITVAAEAHWFHISWQNAVFGIFLLLVIGTGNIFFAEQRRADCKLRAAQEENVALAAVAERERIARDLHDVLGHTLSVIVLKAELAGRLMDRDPQRAAAEIADVERTARTALAEVREAIGGYRARGLVAEIEAARRTLDAAGVTLQCDAMPSTNTGLRANEETVLALALREAVTNIVRHARATTCTLRFHMEDGQHRLSVQDDGENKEEREGNGLRGMRERVEALGGRVSLDRSTGTRLLIALPAHAEAHLP
jgi:two-component system sensor histidine kinase DesK